MNKYAHVFDSAFKVLTDHVEIRDLLDASQIKNINIIEKLILVLKQHVNKEEYSALFLHVASVMIVLRHVIKYCPHIPEDEISRVVKYTNKQFTNLKEEFNLKISRDDEEAFRDSTLVCSTLKYNIESRDAHAFYTIRKQILARRAHVSSLSIVQAKAHVDDPSSTAIFIAYDCGKCHLVAGAKIYRVGKIIFLNNNCVRWVWNRKYGKLYYGAVLLRKEFAVRTGAPTFKCKSYSKLLQFLEEYFTTLNFDTFYDCPRKIKSNDTLTLDIYACRDFTYAPLGQLPVGKEGISRSRKKTCILCRSKKTRRCACKCVRYCSKKCQRIHWRAHSDTCSARIDHNILNKLNELD